MISIEFYVKHQNLNCVIQKMGKMFLCYCANVNAHIFLVACIVISGMRYVTQIVEASVVNAFQWIVLKYCMF